MRHSPCPHCGVPCDEAQRYCLSCGAPCNDASARLLALAGGVREPDSTSAGSPPNGDGEPALVAPVEETAVAEVVPLRNDRRALTSFGLAVAGVLLLLITGWGTDTAQTLASALPPGLSVTYPGAPGIAAVTAAITGEDTSTDSATVDDTVVDDVPVDDTVFDQTPIDDTVVDDTTVNDTTSDAPADDTVTDDTTTEETAPPPIKHVYVIVLADQDVAAAAQTPETAPYLAKTLAAKGTILSGYRAIAKDSLPNSMALVSGQGPTPETAAGCPAYTDVTPGDIGDDGQDLGAGCVHSVQIGTVGDQLASNGSTWRAYVEGPTGAACRHPVLGQPDPNQAPLPVVAALQTPPAGDTTGQTTTQTPLPGDTGQTTTTQTPPVTTASRAAPQQAPPSGDAAVTWRDPFAYFHTATDSPDCAKLVTGLDALDADLAAGDTAPALSYIVPDRCHDGSPDPCFAGAPAGTTAADAWLSAVVPKILASKAYADDGLLAITSDRTEVNGADDPACCRPKTYPNLKATGGEGGRVGALLVSRYVAKGQLVDTSFSHFSLLRSIEDIFGLEPLGYAGLKTVGSLVPDVIAPTKP